MNVTLPITQNALLETLQLSRYEATQQGKPCRARDSGQRPLQQHPSAGATGTWSGMANEERRKSRRWRSDDRVREEKTPSL